MAGISGDGDPAELSADAQWLDDAIADGYVLLGWAPLARSTDRTWPLPGLAERQIRNAPENGAAVPRCKRAIRIHAIQLCLVVDPAKIAPVRGMRSPARWPMGPAGLVPG